MQPRFTARFFLCLEEHEQDAEGRDAILEAFDELPYYAKDGAVYDFTDNLVDEADTYPLEAIIRTLESLGYTLRLDSDDEYVKHHSLCPRCGAAALDYGDTEYTGRGVTIDVCCLECGLEYYETYEMTGYGLID